MAQCRMPLRGLRSVARSPRSGGRRQIDRASDARVDVVTEPDRRSSRATNPNSRLNASAPPRRSSHPQGREATMQHEAYQSTVRPLPRSGFIRRVAGRRHRRLQGRRSTSSSTSVRPASPRSATTDQAIARLVAELSRRHNVRLVVIEATGRYHRRVAATLLAAGSRVASSTPSGPASSPVAAASWRRPIAIDARVLAEFGRGDPGTASPSHAGKTGRSGRPGLPPPRAGAGARRRETEPRCTTSFPSSPQPVRASCCGWSTSRSRTWTARSPD